MRGALCLLAVDGPAVAVEHVVRATQPFGLVLARVQARDRGEEENLMRRARRARPTISPW